MLHLAIVAALAAAAPEVVDIGAAPDRDAGIALIESAVRDSLKDPDSAKFAWPNGFTDGWYRIPFGKKVTGWITCGTVNAKNSYGGYVGSSAVIAGIRNGAVVGFNIDLPDTDTVASICAKVGVPVR
jgi:hypothetical protein